MRNRNSLTKLNRNYVKVSNKLLDMKIHAISIAIYYYLMSVPETFDPSVTNIAKSICISRPSVIKYIQQLLNRNIIRKYRQGGIGKVTKYEFILPEEWK